MASGSADEFDEPTRTAIYSRLSVELGFGETPPPGSSLDVQDISARQSLYELPFGWTQPISALHEEEASLFNAVFVPRDAEQATRAVESAALLTSTQALQHVFSSAGVEVRVTSGLFTSVASERQFSAPPLPQPPPPPPPPPRVPPPTASGKSCESAQPFGDGSSDSFSFDVPTNAGGSIGSAEYQPQRCAQTYFTGQGDVYWLRLDDVRAGVELTLTTCGFDTDLSIFVGSCGSLVMEECNGDADLSRAYSCQVPYYSALQVLVPERWAASQVYIVVGGYYGALGGSRVALTYPPRPPLPASALPPPPPPPPPPEAAQLLRAVWAMQSRPLEPETQGFVLGVTTGYLMEIYVGIGSHAAFFTDGNYTSLSVAFAAPFASVDAIATDDGGLVAEIYLNEGKTFFGLTRVGNPAPVFKPGRAAVVSFPQGTSADRIAIDYSSEKTSLELLGAPAIPLGP